MLVAERHAKIVELILQRGSVQVEELSRELQVSTMTIRRDLEKLDEEGVILRCHGGAVAKQEVGYAEKRSSHQNEKSRIAAYCATLVKPGESVFLDAGTTTYEIAKRITAIPEVMVITNDLEIAQLINSSECGLIICGGQVQKSTGSVFGYYATQMMENIRVDIGFFGAASIDNEFQVCTPTIEKRFLKQMLVERCQQSYLAVDDSKFGKQAMNRINHLKDYTGVVTDRIFDEKEQKRLEKDRVNIIQV